MHSLVWSYTPPLTAAVWLQVLKWHKAQHSRRSRDAQARLNALKLQDYSGYLALAAEAKDSRLREVIDATEAVMDDLIHKVRPAGPPARTCPRRHRWAGRPSLPQPRHRHCLSVLGSQRLMPVLSLSLYAGTPPSGRPEAWRRGGQTPVAVVGCGCVQVKQHQAEQGREPQNGAAASRSEAPEESALPAHERYFNAVHCAACARSP